MVLPEKKVDFEDSDDEADRKDGGEVDIQAAHDKNMCAACAVPSRRGP